MSNYIEDKYNGEVKIKDLNFIPGQSREEHIKRAGEHTIVESVDKDGINGISVNLGVKKDHKFCHIKEVNKKVEKQVKVSYGHVMSLVNSLEFKFTQVEDTTKTICTAILPNGFMIGSGESACVVKEEFDFELGCKFAKERAINDATNKLWEMEGYLLKVTGHTSEYFERLKFLKSSVDFIEE